MVRSQSISANSKLDVGTSIRPIVAALLLCLSLPMTAVADQGETIDVAKTPIDAKSVAQGLFPEDECEQLKAAGFKCMGFKPAVRYSLPAIAFKLGSADLPDALKKQLEIFADVLRARKGSGKVVRIEGHADASGIAANNLVLSQRRAESVREFLVTKGADPAMLQPVGLGANVPKNASDPLSAENRRVEIGRADPPR